jgi:SsrA-binding protein
MKDNKKAAKKEPKTEDKKEDHAITTNREARRDYFILESLEAGIILVGCEVKSLREKQASLAGSFARIDKDELVLYNCYIAPYEKGNRENLESRRERKLLVHKSQLNKLRVKTTEKGLAIVPLKMYFNDRGLAKVEIAVVKGKKLWDKRTDLKKASTSREIDRAIKNRNRK